MRAMLVLLIVLATTGCEEHKIHSTNRYWNQHWLWAVHNKFCKNGVQPSNPDVRCRVIEGASDFGALEETQYQTQWAGPDGEFGTKDDKVIWRGKHRR